MKAEKTIALMRSGAAVIIAGFGDSLTRGWMVRKGYLEFLREMLTEAYPDSRITMINRGVPGDTAEGGLYRLRDDIIEHNPRCTLVQFALNDAFIGFNPALFKNNVRAIIDTLINDTDSEVVLVTSVYIHNSKENVMAERFYEKLEELSVEFSLPIARVHEYWRNRIREGVNHSTLVQYDGIHPTIEGYKLMAEAVMDVFR